MLSIKEKLLTLYTFRALKANRVARCNVGFQQAQLIGLIYTQGDAGKQVSICKLVDQLKHSGKQIKVFYYLPKPLPPNQALEKGVDTYFPSFTKQAISYLGKVVDGSLAEFINTPFDYLYHIDLVSNPILDYLLAKSKAKCRVGNFALNRSHLFEVMVKFEQKNDGYSIDSLTNQMLYYTQRLSI